MAKNAGRMLGQCKGGRVPGWVITLAVLLTVALVLMLAWQWAANATRREAYRRQQAESFAEQAATEATAPVQTKQAQLVFLYMNGCGWCDRMRPHWDAFVTDQASELATLGVQPVDYERKDERAKAYSQYVDGYPTVLFVCGDTVTKFDGERTPEGFMAFVRMQAASCN